MNYIETCPDNHHCENGSKCVHNPYDDGSYYCDCDEVIWDVHYEGLFCEHKAEIYCTDPKDVLTEHWFCTNGGTCSIETKAGKDSNWKCDCPEKYEGSYCQFVKGSRPEGYPFTNNNNNNNNNSLSALPASKGVSSGAVVGWFVTVAVFAAIGVALFIRYKSSRSGTNGSQAQRQNKDIVTGRDLELDADGSLLTAAVSKSMQEAAVEATTQNKTRMEMVEKNQRPGTGLSYAPDDNDKPDDDSSMMSFT
jgi:hypothetical protein